MDRPSEQHRILAGTLNLGEPLKDNKQLVYSGKLWIDDGAELESSFCAFFPYTSVEGFVAYIPMGGTQPILVNRSYVSSVYLDQPVE